MYANFDTLKVGHSQHEELTDLWNELDLKGLLLESATAVNNLCVKDTKPKNKIFSKPASNSLESIYKKDSFKVLMSRYKTAPKPPRYLTEKKIEHLADPIQGKFKGISKSPIQAKNDYVLSPSKITSKLKNRISIENLNDKKQTKDLGTSFFLTGEDEHDLSSIEDEPITFELPAKNNKQKQNSFKFSNQYNSCKTKNTKTNRSLFVDNYLRTKNNPVRTNFKLNKKPSKLGKSNISNVKSKYLNLSSRPDWSLRPQQADSNVLPKISKTKPSLPVHQAKKDKKHSKISKLNKSITSNLKNSNLRSKSSADIIRPNRPPENIDLKDISKSYKKPSSTSSLFNKSKENFANKILKAPTVLTPIKPVKAKEPDISNTIYSDYKQLQQKLGVGNNPSNKAANKVRNSTLPENRPMIDNEIKAVLRKAQNLAEKNDSSCHRENNISVTLGAHAKKLSFQFSELDQLTSNYKKLTEDIE
jgi:hypothetical protein